MLFLPILIFAAVTAIDGFTIKIIPRQSQLKYDLDLRCSANNNNNIIPWTSVIGSFFLVDVRRQLPHPCPGRKYDITVAKYDPQNNNEVVGAKHTQFGVHIDDTELYTFEFQG